MRNSLIWLYVIGAVSVALLANSVSAIWAKGDENFSIWFFALLIISPLVFISFGLATARLGVAVSSGVIDSLLTLSTIVIGLVFFQEWDRVSQLQYLGMGFAFFGIILMLFFPKLGT